MVKTFRRICFVILLSVSVFVGNVLSQGSNESCDGNRASLDSIKRLYEEDYSLENTRLHKKNYEMVIIIVARLGAKEFSAGYNFQRLKETKAYLMKMGIPESNILVTQGDRVKDKGRVEIYYGGFLYFYITLKPKQKLNLLKGGFCDYG